MGSAQPTHISLTPPDPSWEPGLDRTAQAVRLELGGVSVERLSGTEDNFRVTDETGRRTFAKLVGDRTKTALQEAEPLLQAVSEAVGRSAGLHKGFPAAFGDGRWLCAYDYIEGRYARPQQRDLRQLGAMLSRVHRSLAGCDAADAVERRAAERVELISTHASSIAEGSLRERYPEVARAIQRWGDGSISTSLPSQIIHGDLNAGNILIDPGGRAHFVDWEELSRSWDPVTADIGNIIERVILARSAKDREVQGLACQFADGYGPLSIPSGELLASIASRSVRALILLVVDDLRGVTVQDMERRKFLRLLSNLEQRRPLIDWIEARFAP
jgi:Ser/Thr protein kinase RdoA (MazF antagonist)